jgi:hypothetical protein
MVVEDQKESILGKQFLNENHFNKILAESSRSINQVCEKLKSSAASIDNYLFMSS